MDCAERKSTFTSEAFVSLFALAPGSVQFGNSCWAQETAAEESSTSSRVGMLRETGIRRDPQGWEGGVQAPKHIAGAGENERKNLARNLCEHSESCLFCVHVLGGQQ